MWPHACMLTTTDAPHPFLTCCRGAGPPTMHLNHMTGPTQTRVQPYHMSGCPSDMPTIAMGSHDGCKTNIDLGNIISNLSASYPGQHTLITHLAMFLSMTAQPFIHIHMPFTPQRAKALIGVTLHTTHTQYAHLQPIQSGIHICRAECTR